MHEYGKEIIKAVSLHISWFYIQNIWKDCRWTIGPIY